MTESDLGSTGSPMELVVVAETDSAALAIAGELNQNLAMLALFSNKTYSPVFRVLNQGRGCQAFHHSSVVPVYYLSQTTF